jgi:para-nitrobenzyl esterase
MKKFLLTIFLYIFIANNSYAYDLNDQTKISIGSANIIGTTIGDDSIYAWFGLPYAQPPVGNLRWKAPRDYIYEDLDIDANSLPNRCMQVSNFYDVMLTGEEDGTVFGSEDCLYLNVFSPKKKFVNNEKLPVMLWIHGGGNTWGYSASPEHIPENFLKFHDVILVTINYRLGPLGWFSLDEIRDNGESTLDQTSNFGTLDMIKSLEWVGQNIEKFGGDPNNVTIFGESAGGRNVMSLMVTPQSKNLFKRGIVQSGYLASDSIEFSENDKRAGSKSFLSNLIKTKQPLMDESQIEDLLKDSNYVYDLLMKVSAEEIISFYRIRDDAGGLIDVPNVIPDNLVIPSYGIFNAFKNGYIHDKEIILGTNRDENKLFMIDNNNFVKRLPKFLTDIYPPLGLWAKPKDKKFYDLYAKYRSDAWKLDAVDNAARYINESNSSNVYAYRFDWDEEPSFYGMNFSNLLGAAHGLEINFLFNSPEIIDQKKSDLSEILYQDKNHLTDKKLSMEMSEYWVNFAYDGNPNNYPYKKITDWKEWKNESNENFIVFDSDNDQGIVMHKAILSDESILQNIASENISTFQKCFIFDDLFDSTTLEEEKVREIYSDFLNGKCE